MGYRLAVDLGTAFAAAATINGSDPVMVELGNHTAQIPSVLFLAEDNSFLVGEAAERRGLTNPGRLVREFKRRFGDPVPLLVGGAPYSAESLMARLLRWIVTTTTTQQGKPPAEVMLTHPANWGGYKRELLDQLVALAGLPPARYCTEPEAAAVNYAARTKVDIEDKIAVYDLGGGTFDVCVLQKRSDGFVVLGRPDGIEHLGGADIDQAVTQLVLNGIESRLAGIDPGDPAMTIGLARLRRDCIDAKEALSVDTDISVPVALPGLSTTVRITRAELEAMMRPALQDTIAAFARTLSSAHVSARDLKTVVLVGGSSRIPLVAEMLQSTFKAPVSVDTHPKHDIARGAALLCRDGHQSRSTVLPAAIPADATPMERPPLDEAAAPPAASRPQPSPRPKTAPAEAPSAATDPYFDADYLAGIAARSTQQWGPAVDALEATAQRHPGQPEPQSTNVPDVGRAPAPDESPYTAPIELPTEGTADLEDQPDIDLGIDGIERATLIGRGGFGAVYRAHQPRLNRVVAVKVLAGVVDTRTGERFEREAYAMGSVAGHPNIVQVLGAGTTSAGRPYLLMPYMPAGSLDKIVPLPWSDTIRQVIRLCGALQTAHRAGVLHRDIKPANVLRSEFGEPVLTDFGIARVSSGFQTTSGVVSASLPYAPPEVLAGRPPSVASDIYALAATAHCLITGSPPFASRPGEELLATYLRISRDPPPSLAPYEVPLPVERVLRNALAKDPSDRPASAAEMGRALQAAQREIGESVTDMALAGPITPRQTVAETALDDDAIELGSATVTAPPQSGTSAVPVTEAALAVLSDATTHPVTKMVPAEPTRPAAMTSTEPPARRRSRRYLAMAGGIALVLVALITGIVLWGGGPPAVPTGSTTSTSSVGVLTKPTGLAVGPDGALFVSDSDQHRVVRVDPNGGARIVVGTGTPGNSGNGGPATEARLDFPSDVAVTADGILYVATGGIVRRVNFDQTIGPVGGLPAGFGVVEIAVAGDGVLFVANRKSVLSRTPSGSVATLVAETPGLFIEDLAVHPDGWLAIADSAGNQVLRIGRDGAIRRLAGLGTGAADPRQDGYPARESALAGPVGVTFDAERRLIFSEGGNNRVRRVESNSTVSTLAGSPDGYGEGDEGDGGPGRAAKLRLGTGSLAVGRDGELYIADARNHRIRHLDPAGVIRAVG